MKNPHEAGFTLIELSILLIIIGLIVGGILTGRDLIDTAAQRAQVAQIQKYSTAVNAFRNKYGGLPGDLPDPGATQFGFAPRGSYAGEGDGNGVLEGNCLNTAGNNNNGHNGCGEMAVFWEDMSEANLIDATILGYDKMGAGYPWIQTQNAPYPTLTSSPGIKDWLPTAKLGQSNFIYVYSNNGMNYFAVSSVNQINWEQFAGTNPGITVQQAYNIDKKIDDGLPQSGSVIACYYNNNIHSYPLWAAGNNLVGGGGGGGGWNCVPGTAATPYLNTNCYDNGGVASGTQQYSTAQNANLQNCALSFKFQ